MFVSIVSAHLQVEALVEGNGAAGTDGLIGLGPSSGSSVRALGNSAAANLPLNGQPIQIKTQVTGAQTQNAMVILDKGFTLPQVPP